MADTDVSSSRRLTDWIRRIAPGGQLLIRTVLCGTLSGSIGIVLLASLLLGPAGSRAEGSGKCFGALDNVRVSEQTSLLWCEDGRETLIIQASYESRGGDFGWVVPVPAYPEIELTPIDIFVDLSRVTRPAEAHGARRRSDARTSSADASRSTRQACVWPSDVTVLPASERDALRGWLTSHGYTAPDRLGWVLRSYMAHDWYYVAVHVNPRALQKRLLDELKEIDPGLVDARQAPEAIAERLLYAADARDPEAIGLVDAVGRILDRSRGLKLGGGEHLPEGSVSPGTGFRRMQEQLIQRLTDASPDVDRDAVSLDEVLRWLESQQVDEEELLNAARAAGIAETETASQLAEELRNSMVTDLLDQIPYHRSTLARYARALHPTGAGAPRQPGPVPLQYTERWRLVAGYRAIPPPGVFTGYEPGGEAGPSSPAGSGEGPPGGFEEWSQQIGSVAAIRSRIYYGTLDALALGITAAQGAETVGVIAPLKLTFDCAKPVYPLLMTNLNHGEDSIRIYVLADGEVNAGGAQGRPGRAFATAASKRLEASDLEGADSLARLVGENRDHITKLTATLRPEQITSDLWFVTGPRSESRPMSPWPAEHRSIDWGENRLLWLASWLLVPVALLGGLVLLRAAMHRRHH